MSSQFALFASRVRRHGPRLWREFWQRIYWLMRPGPLLSIVVPVYNVEQYLDACLTSSRRQFYRKVEIVVVDDGSPDGSLAIAERHAKKDKRVKIVRRSNGGLSAARNTGVDAATGEFLTFVDSDDLVELAGFAHAMRSLQKSGSSFAILPYARLRGARRETPVWIGELYAEVKTGVTIADHPELMVHATAWSKVYRRDFWDANGLRFREGVLYEDQEVTARAHAAATGVDVVPTPNYLWRIRPQSITREFSATTMHGFMDAIELSLEALDAVSGARRQRARQVLSNDIPHYVRNVIRVQDESFVQALAERLPSLLAEVEPEDLVAECPAQMRVAYRRLTSGNLQEFFDFLNHDGLDLSAHEAGMVDGRAVVSILGDTVELSARQTPLDAMVLRASLTPESLELSVWGYLRHIENDKISARAWLVDRSGRRVSQLTVTRSPEKAGHRLRATRESCDSAVWLVRADSAVVARVLRAGGLRLELEVTQGGRTRTARVDQIDPNSSAAVVQEVTVGRRRVRLDGTAPFTIRRSFLKRPASKPAAEILDVRSESGRFVVDFRTDAAEPQAFLVSKRVRIAGVASRAGDVLTAVFEPVAPFFDRGVRPLPLGDLEIVIRSAERRISAAPAIELLRRAPFELPTAKVAGRLVRVDGDHVRLRIDKPRTHLEQTVYGQRRLRAAYRTAEVTVDPQMALFQCYGAEVATDSPLAIHQEMYRRHPDWKFYWGVVDHSVPLPEGAIGVVAGSREWYEVLARAKWLVKNIELPAYLNKRPGQVHIQTFHGQVFKTMGSTWWREVKGAPEWRVRYEVFDRRAARWDIITTANAESDAWYRDLYFYDGSIFQGGLPRTDALIDEAARERRSATRRALGIADDQIAVLHAATWRDNRRAGPMGSFDVDYLDPGELAEKLGSDYVILQRSHGSVARTTSRYGNRSGVIDVTDHPEINDLILASDLAVLDYSSLRFDYALTGKPMVFFVPDLHEYSGEVRGFLFEYEPTAPGPLVEDPSLLVAAIRNPEPEKYAEQYRAFNQRFNANHDGQATRRFVDRVLRDF